MSELDQDKLSKTERRLYKRSILAKFCIDTKHEPPETFIFHYKRDIVAGKWLGWFMYSAWMISAMIVPPLFYMRDRFLPPFLEDFAYRLKMDIFNDRYLHLIEQGGIGFADRFFIAYAIILSANAAVIVVFTLPMAIIVRRYMVPAKRINKKMIKYFLFFLLFAAFVNIYLYLGGALLNQSGRFRADDSIFTIMLPVNGIVLPSLQILFLAVNFKMIFTLYDAWRDHNLKGIFDFKT